MIVSDGPVIFLSRAMIRSNWSSIQSDPDNSRSDLLTPDEFIAAAERGAVVIGGVRLEILDALPKNHPL